MPESLRGGSHVLHVHLGGRRGLRVGVSFWVKSCSRKLRRYLCEFPFSFLPFFFFWMSCSSSLIYCMCSRGFGKLERGVLKLFSFQKEKKLAGVHISVLKLCRLKSPSGKMEDMRDPIASGDTR